MEDKDINEVFAAIREVRNTGTGYGTVTIEIKNRKIVDIFSTIKRRLTVDKARPALQNSDGLEER